MGLKSGRGVLPASAERTTVPVNELTAAAPYNKTNSATSLLIDLFRKTPPRSPRKHARIMAEKGISAARPRTDPQANRARDEVSVDPFCEVTQIEISESTGGTGRKDLRTSTGSSQVSYYEGDKEFEETIAMMDDEQKVEALVGPNTDVPLSSSSGSGSSGSSLSRTTSDSTAATSVESLTPGNNEKRRKRDETDEYPYRRAKAPLEQQDLIKRTNKTDEKNQDDQSLVPPINVSASHQRHTKMDRPLPRSLCDPGHSTAIASATKVTVSSDRTVEAPETPTGKVAVQIQNVDPARGRTVANVGADVLKKLPAPISPVVSKAPCKTEYPASMGLKPASANNSQSASNFERKPETPVIIAHNENKQLLMDSEGIAVGVQYEIARGITQGWWTWEDITEGVVKRLRGTNFEKAGKVANAIGVAPPERLSTSVLETRQAIYVELDREAKAFAEDKGRGLGLMGPWEGKENWYGGCVQLTAKVVFDKENSDLPFSIRLNSFGMGKSNRAARRFTSLSILQVKFEKEALYDEKNYRMAFCSKEGKIFFVETRQYQRQKRRLIGDHLRLSFSKITKLVNPLDLNKDQVMNKWLARWQLILSTTRPVVEFKPENIFLDLDDVYGDDSDKDSIMTDGCGLINLSALRLIAANTNSNFPVVVHGRIAGAKGLWLLHPSAEHRNDAEPPKIWIRKSQLKINLPPKESWDRSLRIFDLVRLPRLTVPSGLNMQTIMNMSYNGVKDKVFVSLMDEGLKKEIAPLTKWEGDNACTLLAKAVEESGGLLASRRSRGAGGEARLYNFIRDEADDDDDSGMTGGLVERDPISGCPSSLFESAHDMLIAGFNPLQNVVLRDKIKYILREAIKSYMEKFHIPVILSAEAFIVPDPYGVLDEGEIYFRCSTAVGDPMTSIDPHTFLGPVLVSRNPTRVPSDIRKVTAVSRDQLLSHMDVIVFSVKGKRSLASYLGGGDYDGDTVTIIADPAIVGSFRNSEYMPEPREVREAFEMEVEKVSEFIEKINPQVVSREERYFRISRKILHGLSDGKVGLYSHMHDNAIYEIGYRNPETIRLAYMFTTCLDSVKSGLRIKDLIFKEDSRKWNVARPECMQTIDENTRNQFRTGIGRRLQRPQSLGPFVLETLKKCAKELGDNALCDFEKLSDKADFSGLDEDLAKPYNETKELATSLCRRSGDTSMLDDIEKIKNFVESLCDEYIAEVRPHFAERSPRKKGWNDLGPRTKAISQINREYARRFQEGLSDCHLLLQPTTLREVKASYAHVYGSSKAKMGRGFGFVVAHNLLCSLKSLEKGGGAMSRECRDYTLVSSNLAKLIREEGC